MSIHVALHYRTSYKYERPVAPGAHVVRLGSATHCRSSVLAYSLIASGTYYDESQTIPIKPATQQKQLRQLQSLAKNLGLQVLPNPAVTAS